MFCTRCGHTNEEQARFCEACGISLGGAPQNLAGPPPFRPVAGVRYAGFWRRFLAIYIDGVVIGGAFYILIMPFSLLAYLAMSPSRASYGPAEGMEAVMGVMVVLAVIFGIVAPWIYEAAMISSSKQATLGKRAVGIVVSDTQGRRISFGRATGRYFGKMVSSLTLGVGYIMAAFTERKQALHDMMADCILTVKD